MAVMVVHGTGHVQAERATVAKVALVLKHRNVRKVCVNEGAAVKQKAEAKFAS